MKLQPQAEGSRPGTPRAGPGAVFGLLGDWLAPIHRALSLARQRVGADGARDPVLAVHLGAASHGPQRRSPEAALLGITRDAPHKVERAAGK